MVKAATEFEDFEEEFPEEEEGEEEEETPIPIQKQPPKRSIPQPAPAVNKSNKFSKQEVRPIEDKYKVYHQEKIDGIIDQSTGKVYTDDIWKVLADISNQLNRIEEKIG
jgi:hypothetical protein